MAQCLLLAHVPSVEYQEVIVAGTKPRSHRRRRALWAESVRVNPVWDVADCARADTKITERAEEAVADCDDSGGAAIQRSLESKGDSGGRPDLSMPTARAAWTGMSCARITNGRRHNFPRTMPTKAVSTGR